MPPHGFRWQPCSQSPATSTPALRWINFETAGLELAKEILRCHADLPVVLTTGYSHVLSERGSRVILTPR